MKVDLAGVLRDVPLTTLAFAIALGWSLYQLALGVGTLIEGVTARVGAADQFPFTGYLPYGGGLTWIWGHHLFTFGQFVLGLVELGTVLLVAVLVRRYSSRAAATTATAPPAGE